MYRWTKKLILLLLVFSPALINARGQKHSGLSIRIISPVFQSSGKKSNEVSCYANKSLLKGKATGFTFFAMNDVRSVPMELTLDGKALPYNCVAKDEEALIFRAGLKDIFPLSAGSSHYRWKWRARAKAPVSPIADVAGQKVKQVKCWFTLRVNKQTYSSDTVSISIQ